ncbi:tyrosine-type recombinase/integrase [Blastococcus xanthinilyticus]|uniref:Integrase/recombinase XerC n=1 Tax=Blastococcus xanthinilyticus TaxID=1564164 RepID=A0A5S5CNY0_9ACTN|nr:tyrosine-type recombinase/integrase [Blastococcus xanthinilyticus]TYP82025.1 integrase/recombinase XerC [Blastococcus xanthinilyticus]
MNAGLDLDVIEHIRWGHTLRGLAANTLRIRADVLNRLHAFTGVPLRHLEPGHVLRFERACIAGRAPETRRAYACHIRSFYRWAMSTGIVETDPSLMLTIPMIPRHLPRPINEADLARALAAARPKLRAIYTLAAYAGLRCVEIAGLDWTDIRRETATGAFLHVRKGKGCKERTVEIGQVVIDALQATGPKRRGPIFLGREGQRIDARSISSGGNRHLHSLGIDATMHQLRHRYGSVAYQLSRDLRMVQEQLGHASPKTTAGYARPSADAAARMVAAMDALPLPNPAPARTRAATERTAS